VSRSIVFRKERVELVRKLEFQPALLRVTDPRSDSTPTLSRALCLELPVRTISRIGLEGISFCPLNTRKMRMENAPGTRPKQGNFQFGFFSVPGGGRESVRTSSVKAQGATQGVTRAFFLNRRWTRIFHALNSCCTQTQRSKLSNRFCQGPWNADLRTPPGPEGSNGSLLCIRRGHPGFFQFTNCDLRLTISLRTHWES